MPITVKDASWVQPLQPVDPYVARYLAVANRQGGKAERRGMTPCVCGIQTLGLKSLQSRFFNLCNEGTWCLLQEWWPCGKESAFTV